MHRMLRPAALLAVAAGVVAGTAPLRSAHAAARGPFTLEARLDRASLHRVDVRPHGTSAGDGFVFSTTVRRDGKPDGRAEFVQTVVDPRFHGVSLRADLLLGDGSLELQGAGLSRRAPGGAKPSAETEMAIVGGTGAYAGAGGTVLLHRTGRFTQRLEVRLGT